ncbi:MAG: alpha/beta fold hydrolase [Desulfosudaceae bacterium]
MKRTGKSGWGGWIRATVVMLAAALLMPACAGNDPREVVLEPLRQDLAIKTGRVEVDNNLSMHYIEAGNGPPVMLVHGWLCSGAFWWNQIPALARHHRVIAVDCIGCGFSDKPLDDEISYVADNQARWILALADRLGLERFSVAGHSLGGHIAAKIALAAPERVDKLVLLNASGLSENPRLLPWYLRAGRFLHLDGPALMVASRLTITATTRLCMYHPDNPVDDYFIEQLAVTSFASFANRRAVVKLTREALFQSCLDDRIGEVQTPTLLISSTGDQVVPPELGLRYLGLLPQARLELVAQAGHLMPLEQPETVNRLMMDFLDRPADVF